MLRPDGQRGIAVQVGLAREGVRNELMHERPSIAVVTCTQLFECNIDGFVSDRAQVVEVIIPEIEIENPHLTRRHVFEQGAVRLFCAEEIHDEIHSIVESRPVLGSSTPLCATGAIEDLHDTGGRVGWIVERRWV